MTTEFSGWAHEETKRLGGVILATQLMGRCSGRRPLGNGMAA